MKYVILVKKFYETQLCLNLFNLLQKNNNSNKFNTYFVQYFAIRTIIYLLKK